MSGKPARIRDFLSDMLVVRHARTRNRRSEVDQTERERILDEVMCSFSFGRPGDLLTLRVPEVEAYATGMIEAGYPVAEVHRHLRTLHLLFSGISRAYPELGDPTQLALQRLRPLIGRRGAHL